MKIKFRKVKNLQSLLMWVGLFCVVSYALLEHASISIPMISSVKMPLLYVGGICIIPLLKIFLSNIKKKRYFYIFLLLFALCAVLLISMKYNSNTVSGFSPERNTIRLVLYLLELFVLMLVFAEKGESQAAIKLIYYYVLLLVVVTDILMFTGLFTFGTTKYPTYFVGTKFTVVYMHFNLLALWVIQQCEKRGEKFVPKWVIWCVGIALVLVAIYVDCMSGVLGAVFMIIVVLRMGTAKKIARILTSPAIFVLSVSACTLFAFVIGFVLNLPVVPDFVENVLGRSTTLTGRVNIYQGYVEAMRNHWVFGYGYGSGNLVSNQFFGCDNAQNAVLHWILQCGIVVTTLMITVFALIMKQVNTCKRKTQVSIELLIGLVYTYIMLGIVEITYSMAFILMMALIFMSINDKKRNDTASEGKRLES